jgi:hypothetical protein
VKGQDLLVLLKIFLWAEGRWSMSVLGDQLSLSKSQVHYSVKNCVQVGLLGEKTLTPKPEAIKEFIGHAVKYLLPAKWLGQGIGIATAHSMEPLCEVISAAGLPIIWEEPNGTLEGMILKPIHPSAPFASLIDRQLYEYLALIDALRSGRAREKNMALQELMTRIESRKVKFE